MSVGSTKLMTGVGSTEPAKSAGTGFAGAGAETGVGSTEPAKSAGTGFAGAGAEIERRRRDCLRRSGE